MVTCNKPKPRCIHCYQKSGYSAELDEKKGGEMCDLVDKYCLVAYGDDCEYYETEEESDAK